jgi:hypothetical protein
VKGSLKLVVITLVLIFGMAAVCADTPVPAVPETQGFSTGTAIAVAGTATETDAYVWQISDEALNGAPLQIDAFVFEGSPYIAVPHIPILDDLFGNGDVDGEVEYSVAYSENTVADQGLVSYTKGSVLDTSNQIVDTRNLQTSKIVEFAGFDTGRAVSSEDLVVDGAGQLSLTELGFICPFAAQQMNVTPQFCNVVEMGSDVDMTLMSLATDTSERHVSRTADVPVAADYDIKVTGIGNTPAQGSVSAFINSHIQEGRAQYVTTIGHVTDEDIYFDLYDAGKAEDAVYNEMTTASGDVTLFSKVMSYQSGVRRV